MSHRRDIYTRRNQADAALDVEKWRAREGYPADVMGAAMTACAEAWATAERVGEYDTKNGHEQRAWRDEK